MTGGVQDHADAILGLLRDVPDLTVYPTPESDSVTVVPAGAQPPYAAVHLSQGYTTGPSGTDFRSSRAIVRAYCHCVGGNAIAARAVAQMVTDALLDVTPDVPARVSFPIRFESDAPPRDDESTGVLVVDHTLVFRLETLPG